MLRRQGTALPNATVLNPAAGQGVSWNAPRRLQIISATFSLTTTATVKNRGLRLSVLTGGNILFYAGAPALIPASQAVIWQLGPDAYTDIYTNPAGAGVVVMHTPMSPVTIGPALPELSNVNAYLDNPDAGDQLVVGLYTLPA